VPVYFGPGALAGEAGSPAIETAFGSAIPPGGSGWESCSQAQSTSSLGLLWTATCDPFT
jgi:hypothetical protein